MWVMTHKNERYHPSTCHTSGQRPIGCLLVIGHFPQKSPTISRSFAENNPQRNTFYGSSPPCITHQYVMLMGDISGVCNNLWIRHEPVRDVSIFHACLVWIRDIFIPAISIAPASHTPHHPSILIGHISHFYVSWLTHVKRQMWLAGCRDYGGRLHCVCIYIYIYIFIYVYVYVYVCIYIYIYIQTTAVDYTVCVCVRAWFLCSTLGCHIWTSHVT